MSDYSGYKGKKVTVTLKDGEVIEGTVEEGSIIGVVIKAKNSSRSALIEADKIASVDEPVAGEKKLKARSLAQVNDGKNRLHLIERHGYAIADVEKMTEDEAKTFHEGLDHSGLGHFHREESPVEAEIAKAEAAQLDD